MAEGRYPSGVLKLYAYSGCSTCRNAVKWLRSSGIEFVEIAIRETPPTVAELSSALAERAGDVRLLFNTSGLDYRSLGLKDKLPGMSQKDAVALLASNGNLVKRPFAVLPNGKTLVGYKANEWEAALG